MTYIRGDLYGHTKVDPIYNAASGYCLPAGRLIPVQFAKMENSYESNVVATRTSIGAMENTLKENKKGVFYNFKDEQERFTQFTSVIQTSVIKQCQLSQTFYLKLIKEVQKSAVLLQRKMVRLLLQKRNSQKWRCAFSILN